MGHGALDAVDTPALGAGDLRDGAAPLLAKIATIGRLIGDGTSRAAPTDAGRAAPTRGTALVAIGASAGGPAALADAAARPAAGLSGGDRHRPARRRAVRRRHGGVAEPAVGAAGAGGRGRRPSDAGHGPARRHRRPSGVEGGRSTRLHAGAARLCLSPVGGCVLSQRRPAMAGRRRRRAADRHGTRRRAGPEGAARQGPLHDRAGPGQQRGLRHAESGAALERRGGHPAARSRSPRNWSTALARHG